MSKTLNSAERRVLGVLIEKSLTQPDNYPISLNAVTIGCNQKSNRDPVMELDEDTVWHTLEALRERGAVARVLPAPGGRVERFKHEIKNFLGWGPRQQAIMTELMLRGPQTLGELRGRCARMFKFESLDAVSVTLGALAEGDPPMARPMSREPGRSAIRNMHLLYPDGEEPAAASALEPATVYAPREATSTDSAVVEALRTEIENLQAEMAELHEDLRELRQRVDRLEVSQS
jgi:uncharacterized protein YceH (UPF0502 family)